MNGWLALKMSSGFVTPIILSKWSPGGTGSAIIDSTLSRMKRLLGCYAQVLWLFVSLNARSLEADSAGTVELKFENGARILELPLVSGVERFKVLRAPNVTDTFKESAVGSIAGYRWTEPGLPQIATAEFFSVEMVRRIQPIFWSQRF